MKQEELTINDFDLFAECIKAINKISPSVKIQIDEFGLKITSRNQLARCEVRSNSVTSKNALSFCLSDLNTFIKLLSTVKSLHEDDFSSLKIFYNEPFVNFKSKKIKTKLTTVVEDKIEKSIDEGFKQDLSMFPSEFEFKTNSNYIKRINSHTFLFSDMDSARIYIKSETDMNNNTVYATLGNQDNDFENSITLEFGLITSGKIDSDNIILNFMGLNLFNMVQSDEIMIKKLKSRNALVAFFTKNGKNDSFYKITLLNPTLMR